MTTKVNKITQAQIRILCHKLQVMARDARDEARREYEQNKVQLERDLQNLADRLLAKHRKALASGLNAEISTWRNLSVRVRLGDTGAAARDAFQKEFLAAAKKAGLDGLVDDTAYIYFPALGMTDRHGNNGPLSVPVGQKEKWERLANEIDSAFMTGDAVGLLDIINNFNS